MEQAQAAQPQQFDASVMDGGPAAQAPQPPADHGAPPQFLHVLDTTAKIGVKPGCGPRTHIMNVEGIDRPFTFTPNEPLKLPLPIAVKFLRIPEFRLTDAEGNLKPYHRAPKQPHEMGAGEKFELADHQTVADYTELSSMALLKRALELPRGELLPDKSNRQALIEFIVKTTRERRKANLEKRQQLRAVAAPADAEIESDEFVPAPEPDEG
jgi:hypothetical protein